jgi:protoporphyrinogen oxidase
MIKQKIAIIGAGPSGFAAAEVFKSNKYSPYFDITIYERNDYVGGKCHTVRFDSNDRREYEVGAVLVSEHTQGYASLIKLLDKYEVSRSIFSRRDENAPVYLNKGTAIDINKIYLRDLKTNPKKFWRVFNGYNKFAEDYLHYSRTRHVGYSHRPKQLNKNLSKVYRHEVNERLSGVMQGYGYADLDDKKLSPPVLYYHQYIEAGEIEHPLHSIDSGTQSIWTKIASTYPEGKVRLNEQVLKIKRDSLGVEVSTNKATEKYDHIVIATPLKPALNFLDLDKEEKMFLTKMKHNNYVTVLCEADGFSSPVTYNVKACTNQKDVGRVMCAYKRYYNSNVVALYLYPKTNYGNDETILNAVEVSLKEDFNASLKNRNKAKVYHQEDYFGHLDTKTLNEEWYEKFDESFQAKNRTLYVSSGLHMETVGASVEYGTKLAERYAELVLQQERHSFVD